MKKDVWLTISSQQQFAGCDEENIDLQTAATLYERGGKYYIAYEESELTGLEGTKTTVKLDGKTVALIRTGTFPSHMLFAEDERHVGLYQTPVGSEMAIATHTSRVHNTIGEDAIEFDASWYQGDDIKALAHDLVEQYGDSLLEKTPEERFAIIEGYGLPTNIARMERDLKRYKINYDVWFRESTLHESGYVKETIDMLTAKGATYETEDGALWLRSTDFGCDKDDVLRRANGFYTYFAADIAYHRNKFEKRGFDRVINIWGADHHGHVKRLQCALDALGLDGSHRLEIVLMQLVRMMQGGEVVRMSKRTGKSLTLTDLLDEIPVDAARFFFNSRAAETQMEFDLDLAIKQDSDNPLYYVQYAHARICSVLKNAQESGIALPDTGKTDLSVLTGADERQLIKQVALLPEEIVQSAVSRDPSRLNKYAVALAQQFHHFYNACRIKDAEPAVRDARLTLCLAAKQTIENVLKLIGVDAPESM